MFAALSAGLARGELVALYQPQITSDGRRLAGAEALLRWNRPEGVVDPGEFVVYAENHGLIEPLGEFILREACRDACAWGDLKISVNVSPLQFSRRDLAAFIIRTAQDAGLPLRRLEIELTETAPVQDLSRAKAVIDELRASGVTVALDDLGCGGSTPQLMRALPFDRVKLGKPTVAERVTPEGAAALAAYVSEARALGLNVTAEGVETREDQEAVTALGCDLLQGYLFAHALTAKEFAAFQKAWKPQAT